MIEAVSRRLHARSVALLATIDSRLDRIMQLWLLLAGLACAVRIAVSPLMAPADLSTVTPYILLILAPFASMVLALRWFADADSFAQPSVRLANVGKWRSVSQGEARRHRLYGRGGIMVSLLVGILLNVPVRALEYLAGMPAISGEIPSWLSTLHLAMTFDVVVMSSLYTVAFVAALRRVPLFPRLLATIWLIDITMQLAIAKLVGAAPGLPAEVALPLQTLLTGNIQKVLISVAIWLPYLILSKRVNVTYRHRVEA